MNSFRAQFLRKVHHGLDIYSFYFDRSKIDFDFLPGQYIQMILDIKDPDNRGDRRHFTIASSPSEKDYLQITVRIIQSTFKEKLLGLTRGDLVEFSGPFGSFVFDEKDSHPKIFLAGGIGVTPFRSMSIFAKDKNYSGKIIVFASFKTNSQILFLDEFIKIEGKMKTFKFIPIITSRVGRINMEMIRKYVENYRNGVYYIVGSNNTVEDLVKIVREMGVDNKQIKFENFTGY